LCSSFCDDFPKRKIVFRINIGAKPFGKEFALKKSQLIFFVSIFLKNLHVHLNNLNSTCLLEHRGNFLIFFFEEVLTGRITTVRLARNKNRTIEMHAQTGWLG